MKKRVFLLLTAILTFATATRAFAQTDIKSVIDQLENQRKRFLDFNLEVIMEEETPPEVSEDTKQTLLVNKENLLDENYIPDSLVDIAKLVSSTKNEIYLQQEAAENYMQMIEAMKADGISLAAVSGYRTYQYQRNLYINKTNYYKKYYPEDEAMIKAGMVVAPPGASEHQTGLAVDVSVSSIGYALDGRFQDTMAYNWLKENGYKYGFIIRYPEEKREITNIIFEPWHLRYVGQPIAEEIYAKGVCLEEYIGYIEYAENIDNLEKIN